MFAVVSEQQVTEQLQGVSQAMESRAEPTSPGVHKEANSSMPLLVTGKRHAKPLGELCGEHKPDYSAWRDTSPHLRLCRHAAV